MANFITFALNDHPILFFLAVICIFFILLIVTNRFLIGFKMQYLYKIFFTKDDETDRLNILKRYSIIRTIVDLLMFVLIVYVGIFLFIYAITEKNLLLGAKNITLGSVYEVVSYVITVAIGFFISSLFQSPRKKYREKLWKIVNELKDYFERNSNAERKLIGRIRNVVKHNEDTIQSENKQIRNDRFKYVVNEIYKYFHVKRYFEMPLYGFHQEGTVHLSWETIEILGAKFIINRVPAFKDGTSMEIKTPPYYFMDKDVQPGNEYKYWLKIKYDGNIDERSNEGVFVKIPEKMTR